MIAPHAPIVASTIRSEDTFGTMWRVRIENVPTPENRAASTNSRSRSDFVWFFTICDMIIQLKPAIATTSTIHDMLDRSGETIISIDRKSTRLNSSHVAISYAVFCLKKKTNKRDE